jgi:hypothetical protein
MPQLKTRCISLSATPPSRCSQSNSFGRASRLHDLGPDRRRQDARHVAGEAATGDVRHALDRQRLHQRQQRLDVDSRRRQDGFGQRRFAVEGLRQIGLRAGNDLAHQRVAVGMRTRRRQAEQHVARNDRSSRR